MAEINYTPPRCCADFMLSEAFIRLIGGPVGSGKTTACIIELFRRSCEQAPSEDGFRYTRFAILRQTLAQLKMTVLKDILQWLRGFATWRVSENTIYVEIGDVRSEWILLPLEDAEDQRRLLSSQLTGAWISECIEIDIELVDAIAGRCARYPGANMGGATWAGIIMDTNFPEEGTQWHDAMEAPSADWQIFKQPSGLSKHAENLPWLLQNSETLKLAEDDPLRIAQGRKYYERLARGRTSSWVKRYVLAEYGIDPSGLGVFAEIFFPSGQAGPWHVVESLVPVQGSTLIVGQDFGRDPCAVIVQVDLHGRLLVLDEIISLKMGLEKHVDMNFRPKILQPRYISMPLAIVGDPAGMSKSNITEETSFDFLKRKGFHAFPAPTNDIDPRLRAVEAWLLGSRMAGPAVLIDKGRCPVLIRALQGGYRYTKVQAKAGMGDGELKAKPDKNQFSHVADAFQYACLSAHQGALGLINRQLLRPRRQRLAQQPSAAGWT